MSEPKITYLGPACEADNGDSSMSEVHRYNVVTMLSEAGNTIGYDPHGPMVVMASEFDRVTAERDALQLLLNAADQRIDELVSAVRSINRGRHHEVFVPGDDEPQYRQRKEWVDWLLSICDEASALKPTETGAKPGPDTPVCRGSTALGTACGKCARCLAPPGEVKFKGMIETSCGTFAVMINEDNVHYGWTFQRNANGMWVSGRKATEAEMAAARALLTTPVLERQRVADSIALMVTEWVETGINLGTDWRKGLPGIIEKRLARFHTSPPAPVEVASRDESIYWLKRIDGIGQNRAELIYSMGFRRHTEVPQS